MPLNCIEMAPSWHWDTVRFLCSFTRFKFSDHIIYWNQKPCYAFEKKLWCCDIEIFRRGPIGMTSSLCCRPLINASTPIRPTGRNSQDFTDAVQSSSALGNLNGTDTVESRDWKKSDMNQRYQSNARYIYQNHFDSPTAARFSPAGCVGLFPDNWEGSSRIGDCSRPAIWKKFTAT